ADVARALVGAHARGIVHRDIKPDNILIADGTDPAAGTPRVKLSDFGLAGSVRQSESLQLTQTGAVMGTPLYMAPEQCRDSSKVAPPAAVSAMGAPLSPLLPGRPPFVPDARVDVIGMHMNEPPPPLRQFCPAASDGLGQVVARCLAKEPDSRYAGAGDL